MESLLAAVILAMAIGAIVIPFATGAQTTAQDTRMTVAVNLAQDLMEEILAKSCLDPNGTEVGENGRSTWDDMKDYNNLVELPGFIKSLDGSSVTDAAAANMTRKAFVMDDWVSGQDTAHPANFQRVVVEVYSNWALVVRLSRLVYMGT